MAASMSIKMLTLWLAIGLLSGTVEAQGAPAPRPDDVEAGRKLAEKDCVACHVRKFGDAATIYLRSDRKVRTPAQLLTQVRYCNTELGTNYFPEEEEHVAAYLNTQYYHFAP